MSARQLVYLLSRKIVAAALLSACAISVAGCSNSAESALATGALAQSQFEAGQIDLANKTINEALQERDDIIELQLLRGRIEMAAQKPINAFTAYRNALALDPRNVEALMGVAQIGLQLGRLYDSEDAADRLLILSPNDPNALIIKGLHNIIKRRYADTLASADAILATSPNDEGAAILKARSLALLGRGEEGFAVLEAARKASGDTKGLIVTLLELHRQQGDGKAMVEQLEKLRQLSPDDVGLEIDEADTLYKLGETARARSILAGAIMRKVLDFDSASTITQLWAEYDPAPLDASALAEFAAKGNFPALKAVARYFLDRNDPASAATVLQHAAAFDDVIAMRARIDVAQGRIEEGRRKAAAILAQDKSHCDALIAKAEADIATKRYDDAIVASQSAISSCPRLVAGYLALARAHQLDGSRLGATIALRDAFDRNDQDSRLTRAYAEWLERTGQPKRALGVARRLTYNAPALLSGWKLYGELCARVPGADCAAEAASGLAAARKRFGIDPRTGELPPTGLFGRLGK